MYMEAVRLRGESEQSASRSLQLRSDGGAVSEDKRPTFHDFHAPLTAAAAAGAKY